MPTITDAEMEVSEENSIERTEQERSYVRVEVTLPVNIERKDSKLKGRMVDLSEGGLKCVLDRYASFNVGEVVRLTFPLVEDSEIITCSAELVRTTSVEEAGSEVLAFQFFDLSGHQDDKIRASVFKYLRLQRRRMNGE